MLGRRGGRRRRRGVGTFDKVRTRHDGLETRSAGDHRLFCRSGDLSRVGAGHDAEAAAADVEDLGRC